VASVQAGRGFFFQERAQRLSQITGFTPRHAPRSIAISPFSGSERKILEFFSSNIPPSLSVSLGKSYRRMMHACRWQHPGTSDQSGKLLKKNQYPGQQ
jgi:hypothetical protein